MMMSSMVFAVDIINMLDIPMRRLIKYRIKCHWIQSKFVRFIPFYKT